MGITTDKIGEHMVGLGWSVEADGGMLVPAKQEMGTNDGKSARATGLEQLQSLTQYVIQLDT